MEKLTYQIRPAIDSDLDELVKLYSEEPSITHSSAIIKKTMTHHLLLTDGTAPTHTNIAHTDTNIVAISITRFRSTLNAYEVECTINEKFRNQGIGFALVKYSINQCQKNGHFRFIANIKPENLSCIQLFEKLGFTIDTSTTENKFITYRLFMKEPCP